VHPALRSVTHRPWPVPQRAWSWRQSWCDLLLAHWPLPVEAVRPLVPPPLVVDEREQRAWVGVSALRLRDVARRPFPEAPGLSGSAALGLRVCVTHDGRPGVYVLALDLESRLGVWAGRRLLHLPCTRASMHADIAPDGIRFRSVREAPKQPVVFEAVYHATAEPFAAQAGALEHWLTERYCLYTCAPSAALYRIELHHAPWPLQLAEATLHENDLLGPHGVELPEKPALAHFVRRLDVVLWSPERIAG
jgi:uncharacterized protein YqjF (DUF2071 family)